MLEYIKYFKASGKTHTHAQTKDSSMMQQREIAFINDPEP
jgi:hypothetical protein